MFSGRRLLCVSPIPIGRDLFRAGAAATKRCLVCFAFSVAVLKFARLDRSTIRVLCPHELTEEDDVCRPRTASLLWRFPAPRASAAISMGCNLFSSGAEDRSTVNPRVEQRSCQISALGLHSADGVCLSSRIFSRLRGWVVSACVKLSERTSLETNREIRTSGLMSGEGKRGGALRPCSRPHAGSGASAAAAFRRVEQQ